MPKLIANMVNRNEAARYLDPVLERLKDQVDLICFLDDNSTDDSIKIAKKHGARVLSIEEPDGVPVFVKDEGRLRSMSLRWLDDHAEEGDWILSIDTDEMFYYPDREYLEQLLVQKRYDVLGITHYQMWNDAEYRIDKAWKPHVSTRMYRYKPGGQIRDIKMACGSEPTYAMQAVRERRFLNTGGQLKIKHLGYARDEDKQAKYDRYMELDGGKFHNINHLKSILDKNPDLKEWEWD